MKQAKNYNTCENCVHGRTITMCRDKPVCHYFINTGELRHCSIDKCDKFKDKATNKVPLEWSCSMHIKKDKEIER